MIGEIGKYNTLVFDCDGVILNSNKIKTEAFYQVALPYGEKYAQDLVEYHINHGGVSRYQKFAWFIENVLKDSTISLDGLLVNYATTVKKALMTCEVVSGLQELREKTKHTNWLICSGGDQAELREIFIARGLSSFFDGGIFGSPDDKKVILSREIGCNNIKMPALFLGDSRYDHESALSVGLDFVFLTQWTEFRDWQSYQNQHGFEYRLDIKGLLE